VRSLASDIPPSSLPPSTTITIIGCGAPDLIPNYMGATSSAYRMYSDPKVRLYTALGMQKKWSMGNRAPNYIRNNMLGGALKSIVQGFTWKGGRAALKAGPQSQNGGEFWFVKGEEDGPMGKWKLEWCHRMRNTRDHTETADLKKVMGVAGAPVAPAVKMDETNGVKQEEEKVKREETPAVTVLNGSGEVQA
jgi:hypothetical protein